MSAQPPWEGPAPTRQQPPRGRHGARATSAVARLRGAWRQLDPDQRLAALAAAAMLLTMFLPWYSQTATAVVTARAGLASTTASFSAFGAFSWVEAAVLLVSAGVIAMLYARGRGYRFRLPGSDGLIVAIGGGWSALLIFYRMVDKPGVHGTARITATVGVEWGIFLSFACAVAMIAAGSRMRAGHIQGPPTMRARSVMGANDDGGGEGWAP